MITNRVYKEGHYSTKEAAIIATGFSTVSATFMLVVAQNLGLSQYWNLYFWVTLIITFLVTAITTRLYPLSRKPNTGYEGRTVTPEPSVEPGKLFSTALDEGLEACLNAPKVTESVIQNFSDGIGLALNIGPTLMPIGFIGLLFAEYTPVFDVIGYIFVPFTMLMGFGQESILMGKSCAISLAEMFLPANIVANASLYAQFVTAIVCVSEILFFSASIPCILGTDIKISIKELLIIWVERVILSLILASLAVRFFFPI